MSLRETLKEDSQQTGRFLFFLKELLCNFLHFSCHFYTQKKFRPIFPHQAQLMYERLSFIQSDNENGTNLSAVCPSPSMFFVNFYPPCSWFLVGVL